MLTRELVVEKAKAKQIQWQQAADLLGVTARQLLRIRRRYETWGPDGLRDRRRGGPRRKRYGEELVATLCELKRTEFVDFSVRHFWETLQQERPELGIGSYSWTLSVLQERSVVEKTKRRGQYRRRRERQPMRGMRVHLDASTHPWLGPTLPDWDLHLSVDDADGRVLCGFFVPEEGVSSTFRALWGVLTEHGVFRELYTDRGSHFCRVTEGRVASDEEQTGQVPRALKTLGVRHIRAYSPQARGRSERIFGTFQRRLIPELRRAGIRDYAAANAYLQDVFIPDYNRRFTVEPKEQGSLFTSVSRLDLALVLSTQVQRVIHLDYTVHFQNLRLQLPGSARGLARRRVLVHVFFDGSLGISHRGVLWSRYRPDGRPIQINAIYPPLPTPAPPARRTHDLTDPNFWDFLQVGSDGPVAKRHDLFA